jgi:selenide,water dikinase
MGGTPLTALSILAWPANNEIADLHEILRGGHDKIAEAGCTLVGGHSVNDEEVKFGFAVTGTVDPKRVLTNSGARAGDVLILTKPIGTGVIGTALKRGIANAEHVEASVKSMTTLNRAACEAMLRFEVHACTDITGFGLLGHAREVAIGSGLTLEIAAGSVRFLPGAIEYARAGAVPGGLKNNREFAECAVERSSDLAPELEQLLYDPQTSGGLLISLPQHDASRLLSAYRDAYEIGRVLERQASLIRIV